MTYPGRYRCAGPDTHDLSCPVCGAAEGQCPAGAWQDNLTYPPVDFADAEPEPGGPLTPYLVTVYGYQSVMRLNATDAAGYGDAAVPII